MCLTIKPGLIDYPLEYEVLERGEKVHVAFPYLLWDPRTETPVDGIDFTWDEIVILQEAMLKGFHQIVSAHGDPT